MKQDPLYKFFNSKKAQKELKNLKFVAFTNKYKETHICFQDGFNFPINDNLMPAYYMRETNILNFYDLFAKRTALALNLVRGKSNKELEKMLKKREDNEKTQC